MYSKGLSFKKFLKSFNKYLENYRIDCIVCIYIFKLDRVFMFKGEWYDVRVSKCFFIDYEIIKKGEIFYNV